MSHNAITVMPCYSLQPNKFVLFNRVFRASDYNEDGTRREKVKRNKMIDYVAISQKNEIQRSSHNLRISDNAYRTLKEKINWLYYLAKSRYVKSYNGRQIYNFKVAFLTFTLPSKQKHSTKEITATMFNNLLTELRQRTGMQNYVWRMEYQKNGNVHYHLCTDTYFDYFFVLPIWNRILEYNGYIDDYRDRHRVMNLTDYNLKYNADGKTDFNVVAKRYAKGKSQDWSQPNSVDVRSVISKKAIANYVAKYFGKNDDGTEITNDFDNEENTANIRLWFCSRSLSKVKNVTDFCDAGLVDIHAVISTAKEIKTYVAQYAKIIYYNLLSLPNYARIVIEKLMRNNAYKTGYIPAV